MDTISVVDPLTGNELHVIDSHSAADVALIFDSARKTQPAWAATEPKVRSKIARRIVDPRDSGENRRSACARNRRY